MSEEIDVSAVVSLIDRVIAPIDRIMKRIDRVTEPVKRVNRAMERIGTAAGFPKIMAGFNGVSTSVLRLGGTIGNLLGPLTAIGSGLTLAGLGKTISDFAEYGGHVDDLSTRLGVSAKAVQEWTHWAKLGGIEQDALESSVGRLNRNLADLANGKNKDLPVLFRKLGISTKDANGHFRNAESLMPDLADAIQRIHDPIARTAVATALFGKTGADLLPALKDGAEGLRAAGEEARKLGEVLDDDAIGNAASFGDDMDRLAGAARGLGFNIASKLLPSLLPLIERLTKWITANRELISARISDVVSKFVAALERIDWDVVGRGLADFASGISRVVDFVGGWQNALIGVVLFMNRDLIGSIFGVGSAIVKLGALLLANPVVAAIGVAVAAIAGLVYVIYKNWDNIANWFQAKLDAVKAAFDKGFLSGILTLLEQFNPTRLFAEAINGLVNYLFG
ncbi:MAG: phage tail tape measure protein, partial [Rhodospirillaceae bacterium]